MLTSLWQIKIQSFGDETYFSGGNDEWISFKVKELIENPELRDGTLLGYIIPRLARMNVSALYNFVLGNFR